MSALACFLAAAVVTQTAPGPAPTAAGDEIEELEEIKTVQPSGESGEAADWEGYDYALIDRGLNLHFAQITRKGHGAFIIDHRTYQRVQESPGHDFLGFDAGNLRVGLGLRVGITDFLDFGFYRLNDAKVVRFDTYEFDLKGKFLHADRHGVDLVLRTGIDWFVQKNADDASGVPVQVLASRTLFERLTAGTGVLYHSDSTNENKTAADTNYSLAVPVVLQLRITDYLAFCGETAIAVAGYKEKYPVFSTGIKGITNRHTFAFVLSNNQHVLSDGIAANTWRGGKDLIIGFTITRELDLDD